MKKPLDLRIIYHPEMISMQRFCVLTPLVKITFINIIQVLRSTEQVGLVGLDVGTLYIGVAVSDVKLLRAYPHGVIMRNDKNVDEMAHELQRVITKLPGAGLIIGYPYIRGRMNKHDTHVHRLTSDLGKTNILGHVGYTYWEEGFTSKLAECVMHTFKPDPQRRKRNSDKFAAAGMLQGYLDVMNNATRSELQDSSAEDEELD